MRNAASLTLIVSSFFLAVVALLVNSPALFYMGTALIATIVAAKLQARFAVRGLKFSRQAPELVMLGDVVNVTLSVESENKFNRPLLLIEDLLPPRLTRDWLKYTIPVAPSYRQPVQVQYQFRPLRRGSYQWQDVSVVGTDALGISSAVLTHTAGKTKMKVLPAPVSFDVDINLLHGSGYEDTAPKRHLTASIDARGVREYVSGDPIRHIHWASSARTGTLMVKDFESQASSRATILLQRTIGSDIGIGSSSLDRMCGHAAFLIEQLLPRCSWISLNEPLRFTSQTEPLIPFLDVLADLKPDQKSFAAEVSNMIDGTESSGRIFLFLTIADKELLEIVKRTELGSVQAFVYDAKEFDPTFMGESAADARYVQQLRDSGARVQLLDGRSLPL